MDNTNKDVNTGEWVYERLARLAPKQDWRPNLDLGFANFRRHEHMAKRRRRLQQAVALAVLIASILALVVPTTRGIARQLLDSFYMKRPEAVRSTMPRSESCSRAPGATARSVCRRSEPPVASPWCKTPQPRSSMAPGSPGLAASPTKFRPASPGIPHRSRPGMTF